MAALEEDTLFLACTRPAMIAGVTMEAMGANMIFTSILFLVAGSILYAVAGVAIHLVFRALIAYDHNMFRVLFAWLETKGRARNARHWGGSSVTPLKLIRRHSPKDWNLA